MLTGSYSYAKFDLDNADSEYRTGFNTPDNQDHGWAKPTGKLTENLGFQRQFQVAGMHSFGKVISVPGMFPNSA